MQGRYSELVKHGWLEECLEKTEEKQLEKNTSLTEETEDGC
jgi:hypothetical protein